LEQLLDLLFGHLVRINSVVERLLGNLALQILGVFTLDLERSELGLAEISSTSGTRRNLGQARAGNPLTVCGQQAQADPLCVVLQISALDCLNCFLNCLLHCIVLHLT
jgi:hypothetical protein